MVMGGQTGDETCSNLEKCVINWKECASVDPVEVSTQFVVHERKDGDGEASVSDLGAVAHRQSKASRNGQPAQYFGVVQGDSVCCEGAIRFVQFVLFWVKNLVP